MLRILPIDRCGSRKAAGSRLERSAAQTWVCWLSRIGTAGTDWRDSESALRRNRQIENGGGDRVLALRIRKRSDEGPAGMKKPRAVSAGAADLAVCHRVYSKPFSRPSAEPLGTVRLELSTSSFKPQSMAVWRAFRHHEFFAPNRRQRSTAQRIAHPKRMFRHQDFAQENSRGRNPHSSHDCIDLSGSSPRHGAKPAL